MSSSAIITTLAGGFIFPFLIRLIWGKLCESWGGPAGGYMAAGFIVGTAWTLTHGVGFIVQSGGAWVDQAFAAYAGLFVASAMSGDNVGKGLVNSLFAIIGGVIAAFVLSNL